MFSRLKFRVRFFSKRIPTAWETILQFLILKVKSSPYKTRTCPLSQVLRSPLRKFPFVETNISQLGIQGACRHPARSYVQLLPRLAFTAILQRQLKNTILYQYGSDAVFVAYAIFLNPKKYLAQTNSSGIKLLLSTS